MTDVQATRYLSLRPVFEAGIRSKGLGKEIIKYFIERCDINGFTELATDTELTNINAQEFYKAAGFQENDRIVAFRIEVNKAST